MSAGAVGRWIGKLEAVRLRSGQRVPFEGLELGIVDGVGLVTAESREALAAGELVTPAGGAPWLPIVAVYYRRRRGAPHAGFRWVHDLSGTEAQIVGGRVAFRARSSVARVCAVPAGDFVCDG